MGGGTTARTRKQASSALIMTIVPVVNVVAMTMMTSSNAAPQGLMAKDILWTGGQRTGVIACAPVSQTGQPEASLQPSADVARQDYAIPMPVSTHGQNPGHHESQTTGRWKGFFFRKPPAFHRLLLMSPLAGDIRAEPGSLKWIAQIPRKACR